MERVIEVSENNDSPWSTNFEAIPTGVRLQLTVEDGPPGWRRTHAACGRAERDGRTRTSDGRETVSFYAMDKHEGENVIICGVLAWAPMLEPYVPKRKMLPGWGQADKAPLKLAYGADVEDSGELWSVRTFVPFDRSTVCLIACFLPVHASWEWSVAVMSQALRLTILTSGRCFSEADAQLDAERNFGRWVKGCAVHTVEF